MSDEINLDDLDDGETIDDVLRRLDEESQSKYKNAPDTLDDALARLETVETLLEDLARGVELVELTKDPSLAHVFRVAAEEYLENKMTIPDSRFD